MKDKMNNYKKLSITIVKPETQMIENIGCRPLLTLPLFYTVGNHDTSSYGTKSAPAPKATTDIGEYILIG